MFRLDGKSAVITGAGSGIGKEMAILFARQGAFVHIIELSADAAASTLEAIEKENGKAKTHSCDVSRYQDVQTVFADIGKVDILINNAGIAHVGNLENTSEQDFDRVFNVNVKGAYNCLSAAIPVMKARRAGVILNLASIAAHVGLSDRFAYSMSKGAMFAITLSIAKDYLKDNIRCNSISPARIHTPFVDGFIAKNYPGEEEAIFKKLSMSQPIGRMGKPQEVAQLALYLCSEEAGFITGSDYPIDGGFITLNT